MKQLPVEIYDTTLRDGAQGVGIAFSLDDALRIIERLDALGIHYIEGGQPGSNPKAAKLFRAVRTMNLSRSRVVAFGSTRHARRVPSRDPNLRALLRAETEVVTIFGKTWDFHARKVLRVSLDENLRMINQSVAYRQGSCCVQIEMAVIALVPAKSQVKMSLHIAGKAFLVHTQPAAMVHLFEIGGIVVTHSWNSLLNLSFQFLDPVWPAT